MVSSPRLSGSTCVAELAAAVTTVAVAVLMRRGSLEHEVMAVSYYY